MIILASHLVSDFGPRHGRRDGFGHPGLFLVGLLVLGAVVALAVVLFRGRHQPVSAAPAATGAPGGGSTAWTPATSAEAILSERFARGEVSVEDFVTSRSALRGEWVPRPTADSGSPS